MPEEGLASLLQQRNPQVGVNVCLQIPCVLKLTDVVFPEVTAHLELASDGHNTVLGTPE